MPAAKTLSKRNVDRPELVFDLVSGSAWFLSEARLPGKGAIQVAWVDASQERRRSSRQPRRSRRHPLRE